MRGRDFIAPRIASVILPIRQYDVFIRQTVIVNRTVVIRDRLAVNPGIAPNLIAKFSGRPLRTFDVRPVVLAGTAQIPGALQVRAQDGLRPDLGLDRLEERGIGPHFARRKCTIVRGTMTLRPALAESGAFGGRYSAQRSDQSSAHGQPHGPRAVGPRTL